MPRRRLILGGEASRLEWIERLRDLAPTCEIYNHYGPTETTVGVLTYHVGANCLIPIRERCRWARRCRTAAFISSIRTADRPFHRRSRGALRRRRRSGARLPESPELTAEKFVPDPFRPTIRARVSTGPAIWPAICRMAMSSSSDGSTIRSSCTATGSSRRKSKRALREQCRASASRGGVPHDDGVRRQTVGGVRGPDAERDQPLVGQASVHVLPDGSPVRT